MLRREPLPLLIETTRDLAPGRALDIACGSGRHAIHLAARGWSVTAVDRSRAAIEMLLAECSERGLSMDARCADLESRGFEIEPEGYDLICDCFYLQRDLFPSMRRGVRPGGIVIAAIPTERINPAYTIQADELRSWFAEWDLLHDEHRDAVAELVARKPTRTSTPPPARCAKRCARGTASPRS